jgi:hypothetical protein
VLLSASTTKVKVDLRDDGEMKTLNALALGARRGPALRKLGVDKPELNTVTVSFEATTGRVGSAAVPEVNTEARLTVNAIDFRVSAAQ